MLPSRWLDTHVHVSGLNPDGTPRERLLEDLLAVLDAEEADLRFVISPDQTELSRIINEPEGQLQSAHFIHDLVSRAPDRLYGACCVNPNYLDDALRTMDLCLGEWGFPLLGELLQYMMDYQMDSLQAEAVVRRAVEFDVPVQVHISTSNSKLYSSAWGDEQLEDLCNLADRVPEARYILAHLVGTPADPPVVRGYLDYIERRYGSFPDNFWAEIRDFSSPGVREVLQRVPHERLIAGTDWVTRTGPPFPPYGVLFPATGAADNPYPPSVRSMADFLAAEGADERTVQRIAWENAAELLGLGPIQ